MQQIFISNPATVYVILSNLLKLQVLSCCELLYIFDLKMTTFMLKVAIEDYFCIHWGTSSAVVLSPLCFDYRSCFDYVSITHDNHQYEPILNEQKMLKSGV